MSLMINRCTNLRFTFTGYIIVLHCYQYNAHSVLTSDCLIEVAGSRLFLRCIYGSREPPVYLFIIIPSVCPSFCATRKCAPYMGALAAAGCAWSARGDPGYAGKWAGLARCGCCTPRSWAQGRSASNGGFLNGRTRRLGAFSTAGAGRLRAFLHYSSSHNRAKRSAIVACSY